MICLRFFLSVCRLTWSHCLRPCADAKTPKFEVPIAFPAIDYEYTFVIDLSFLDSAAQVFRACITVSFILALISITPKMIKW